MRQDWLPTYAKTVVRLSFISTPYDARVAVLAVCLVLGGLPPA